MSIEVRHERPGDEPAIDRVHAEAHGSEVVPRLVDDLRTLISPGRGASFDALDGDRLVGSIMFTPNLLDAPRCLLEVEVLSPLSVLPSYQRRGVGAALVETGLREMTKQGVPLVFLEGVPRYYPRFGFFTATELGFRKPSLRIPDEAFMVLRLPSYESWMTGTLVYSDVFWRHDAVGLRESSSDQFDATDAPA